MKLDNENGTSSVKGKQLTTGCASRFIRKSWFENGSVTAKAFELREGTPPELYVSHMIAIGTTDHELCSSGNNALKDKKLNTDGGYIALLDIAQVLEQINDEEVDLIQYFAHGLPHCGLYFVTELPDKLVEVRTTLRFMATNRLHFIDQDGNVSATPTR